MKSTFPLLNQRGFTGVALDVQTFGDTTSPVAGMVNISSNIAQADHGKYMVLAARHNFVAAGVAAVLSGVAVIFR